jgi:hypothetical protein
MYARNCKSSILKLTRQRIKSASSRREHKGAKYPSQCALVDGFAKVATNKRPCEESGHQQHLQLQLK